jgi:hypothetical protein
LILLLAISAVFPSKLNFIRTNLDEGLFVIAYCIFSSMPDDPPQAPSPFFMDDLYTGNESEWLGSVTSWIQAKSSFSWVRFRILLSLPLID